jgi:hypothetical protein
MSKLMWIAGILLTAAGVALGLMVLVSAASVAGWGIGLDLAALLLVSGILSLGLGSVISLLEQQRALLAGRADLGAVAPQTPIPEFGRKAGETAAAAAAAREGEGEEVSEPTRDTIKALEQARQKIEQAFEPKTQEAEAAEEAAASEAEPEEEVTEQPAVVPGQLYVVEERFIRMRPARILSDGTVEAETEEGWMRFENLEHLDEYLDATETAKG